MAQREAEQAEVRYPAAVQCPLLVHWRLAQAKTVHVFVGSRTLNKPKAC